MIAAPAEVAGAPRGERRAIAAWCLFDWANSAFPTVNGAFVSTTTLASGSVYYWRVMTQGAQGNGISPMMVTQQHWLENMKEQCMFCHQLGDKTTRTLLTGGSSVEGWAQRIQLRRMAAH